MQSIMKRLFGTITLILLLWRFPQAGVVKTISLEQGLSQSVVFDVVQDSTGFIWVATQDGLNRFDGHSFKTFRFIPNDSTSLSDNWITTLMASSDYLWIGTHHGGLNRMDLRTETFQHFFSGEDGRPNCSDVWIQDIVQDHHKRLWIATWGKGLICYYPVKDSVRVFSESNGLSNNFITSIQRIGENIWVGSKCGLNRIDMRTDSVVSFFYKGRAELSTHNFITALLYKNDSLWLGSLNGLKQFNSTQNNIQDARISGGALRLPEQYIVTSLLSDHLGAFWMGTKNNGLFRIEDNRLTDYTIDRNNREKQVSAKYIRCLFQDRSDNLWIGTWGNGIYLKDISFPLFKGTYGKAAKDLLKSTMVNALVKDRQDRLWVGTSQAGITVLNKNGSLLFRLGKKKESANSLSDDRIHALAEDEQGNIWIGTQKGLDKWNGTTVCHELINYKKRLLIWKFYKDHLGTLWIGHRFGLIQYIPENGRYCDYDTTQGLAGDEVTAIFEDYRGHLWVGSRENGLTEIIFKEETKMRSPKRFRHFRYNYRDANGLCSNNILSINASPDTVLWVGTNQGLNRLSLNTYSIKHFYQSHGLPNDVIYSIVTDEKGLVWVATNRGVSCFNPKEMEFINFTPDHGLQSYEFNQGSFTKDKYGNIYLGGINGYNFFHPDSIKQNDSQQKTVFTNIIADGVPVALKGIPFLTNIKLPYKIHTLSFEFSTLEFLYPDLNKYACLMDGVDRQWHQLGNRHSITYTNLTPGDYRFAVKATNREGVWSSKVKTLMIHIPPPFWKSWWFIMLSILFVLALSSFLILYRIRQLLAVERFQKQIAADLHDEIGAGLSEINILSAILETKTSGLSKPIIKSELGKIGERSRSLMNEMNDIVWLIKPRKDTLHDLFFHLRGTFNDVLEAKNMNFAIYFSGDVQNIVLKMEEKHHVYLLFKEAMNNAIKYSKSRNIKLSVKEKDRRLSITLTDDGIGFDPNGKRNSNGLKNMRHRARQLHGTLKIESASDQGTSIVFSAKIRKNTKM